MRSAMRSTRRSGDRFQDVKAKPERGPRLTVLRGPLAETVDFYLLLVLLGACALGGGTAFADTPSLLFVRPIATACLFAFLLTPARADWSLVRLPSIFLALFAGLMLIQLIPLPPGLWTALPGRAVYANVAAVAGFAQPWRPWSLTPDLTANSLVSLIVPAAVIVGFAKLREEQRQAMVIVLIILCCLSAALGIAQFSGGLYSPLYLYRRTYEGYSVGFLSNRNHQAVLLAMIFPALRAWTMMPASKAWATNRQWLALALGVLVVPCVLATGSRAGLALTLLGIAAAFVLYPTSRSATGLAWSQRRRLVWLVLPLLVLALVALTYLSGRAASIERLISISAIDSDQRFQFAPVVIQIIGRSFPFGTGFGSFDVVFRQYEPNAILIDHYFNHAHNELLELTFMAGLPGLVLLLAFLAWWGMRMVAALRRYRKADATDRIVRLGGTVIALLLLSSLVDYPLRTPLMAAVFAMACCWLGDRRGAEGL